MQWYKEIEKNRDFTFLYTEYSNGISVTPSSATAVFYDNKGTEIQASTAAVLNGDEMQFTLTGSNIASVGKNFKIEMSFTTDSAKTVAFLFDVVNIPIQNVVRDEDLFEYVKDLRTGREKSSEITSATTTTFVDTRLGVDGRDWKGGRGTFLADTGNTDFKVTAYTQSTSTITYNPATSVAPAVGSKYIIRMSYQDQIDIAFAQVLLKIRGRVGLAAGYIDTNVFNTLVVYKCLEQICLNSIEESGDKWEIRKEYYQQCYLTELNNFFEAYDNNEDGNIDDEEDKDRPTFASISNTRGNGRCLTKTSYVS